MAISRSDFLARIRDAVAAGNRAGVGTDIPRRGTIGYQGAGTDPVACFIRELETAGGKPHVADGLEALCACLTGILQGMPGTSILFESPAFLDGDVLAAHLRSLGKQITCIDELPATESRDSFFAADFGVSGVEWLIAETGSIVMATRPGRPRSTSLLPPVHVAIAARTQIMADLFDLFDGSPALPSCLTLITGPSKTGDIELRLVTGVHGPGEVHVVICSWA
ncbi:MAG: hypothetical protein FJ271_32785 [Planctomycetes bacterium]|nr:hypothetical protein [Planctomycetota bacterium]